MCARVVYKPVLTEVCDVTLGNKALLSASFEFNTGSDYVIKS